MDEDDTSQYLFSLTLSEEQHKGHILLRRCPGANAPSGPQAYKLVLILTRHTLARAGLANRPY